MALYVTAEDEKSPAERFGLTVGCALLAIDSHPLNDGCSIKNGEGIALPTQETYASFLMTSWPL